MKIETRKLPR
ncbi:hypothetical protein CP8484711_1070, partial [Chlamydia psittaci 84-8471/1]